MSKRQLLLRAWIQITVGIFGEAVKNTAEAIASLLHLPGNLLKIFTACVIDILHTPGMLFTAFGMWVWQTCAVAAYVLNPTTAGDKLKNAVPGWVVEMMAVRDEPPKPSSGEE